MITLPREELATVSATATALQQPDQPKQARPARIKPQVDASVNAVRAPGAARSGCTRIANPYRTLERLGWAGFTWRRSRWSLRRACRW